MRIAHLTVVRKITDGQKLQLISEMIASGTLADAQWVTVALHSGEPVEGVIFQVPVFFRPMILRSLYGWMVAIRLSRKVDVLLMRHVPFDVIGVFLSPFVNNRVSVHHSKEIEELRLVRRDWRGLLASHFERICGPLVLRRAVAVAGVTEEISRYEVARAGVEKPMLVYANAINVESITKLDDCREASEIHVAFMCGTFSPWHGLDKIVQSVSDGVADHGVKIHLIGKLSDEQEQEIQNSDVCRRTFVSHGTLSEDGYRPILSKCDIGLTSFALERKGLQEASTIKVREMLAMGLPVLSGHSDRGVDKLKSFRVLEIFSVADLVKFATEMKKVSRSDVRESARGVIDKSSEMARLVSGVRRLS